MSANSLLLDSATRLNLEQACTEACQPGINLRTAISVATCICGRQFMFQVVRGA